MSGAAVFDEGVMANAASRLALQQGPGASASLYNTITANLDVERIIELLPCANPAIVSCLDQRIREIKKENATEYDRLITLICAEISSGDPNTCHLLILTCERLFSLDGKSEKLTRALLNALFSMDNSLARNALHFLAVRNPDCLVARHSQIQKLLKESNSALTPTDIASILCLTRRQCFALPILGFYFSQDPTLGNLPRHFGLILQPDMLAQIIKDTELGVCSYELGKKFGYFSEEITPEIFAQKKDKIDTVLRSGICFVNLAILEIDDFEDIKSKILSYKKVFVSAEINLAPQHIQVPFDNNNPQDFCAFLSAIREHVLDPDINSLEIDDSPPTAKTIQGLYAYCDARFLLTTFIEEPLKKIKLKEELNGCYLLHHAATKLVSGDHDKNMQNRIWFEAYWKTCAKDGVRVPIKNWPPVRYLDCPDIIRLISNRRPTEPTGRFISPGLSHFAGLAAFLNWEESTIHHHLQILNRFERIFKTKSLPIGCEVQHNASFWRDGTDRAVAWKQLLRGLGIPSPERERFMHVVEAAFRPCCSGYSLFSSIFALSELGIVREGCDPSLHISLQAGLDNDHVRHIMFPLYFLGEANLYPAKKQQELYERINRAMSKGYAHRHKIKEIEFFGQRADLAQFRTELRGFKVAYRKQETLDGTKPLAFSAFTLDYLLSTQLLSTAAVSEEPKLQTIWAAYIKAVQDLAKRYGQEYEGLLAQNWFEHTGDARDFEAVKHLNIIKAMQKLKQWRESNTDQHQKLKADTLSLVGVYTRHIFDFILEDDTDLVDLLCSYRRTPLGLPLVLPNGYGNRIMNDRWVSVGEPVHLVQI